MKLSLTLAFLCSFFCNSTTASTFTTVDVVFLGTGTPNPDPNKAGPSLAVISGRQTYLVDAGMGILQRATQAGKKYPHLAPRLQAHSLNKLFLTHLHSDHTLGLDDLMFGGWIAGRMSTPLKIYGPTATSKLTHHLQQAYHDDLHTRTQDVSQSARVLEAEVPKPQFEMIPYTKDQKSIQLGSTSVTPFLTPHGNWDEAYGLVFEAGGKKIVISGDTAPNAEIAQLCNGCDLLIHEVYSKKGLEKQVVQFEQQRNSINARLIRNYNTSAHTSTEELAQIAKKAKPKKLILYHQLYFGVTDADLIQEIKEAGYSGQVFSAQDLDRFTLD